MSAGILHFLDKSGTVKSQTFTTSGSFVVPKGITTLIVEGQGAGGGGLETPNGPDPNVTTQGSGGGAGHFGIKIIPVASEVSIPVVVGFGGNGGSVPTDGGDTSVGFAVFKGGKGGGSGVTLNGSGSGGSSVISSGNRSQSGPSGQGGVSSIRPGTLIVGPALCLGGGGSGLGDGGDGNGSSNGGNGGIGAGGGAGVFGGVGGRGQVTIYWIDPS